MFTAQSKQSRHAKAQVKPELGKPQAGSSQPNTQSTRDTSIKLHEGTEYLTWFHEAMVVEVDAKAGRVITFETGPIGLRTRNLDKVVNRWDVYMGFATSAKEREGIDEYLKDIVPGR